MYYICIMELSIAKRMATELMEQHGLLDKRWYFEFDSAKRRFGVCRYGLRCIGLSKYLVALNDEAEVRDTILHEIAHALVGPGHGHGPVWKAKCVEIGCRPVRCYSSDRVVGVEASFVATCPSCGSQHKRHKMPPSHRRYSCRCYPGRGYTSDSRYALVFNRVQSMPKPVVMSRVLTTEERQSRVTNLTAEQKRLRRNEQSRLCRMRKRML